MKAYAQLFASMGTSLDSKRETPLKADWLCYSLNHDNPSRDVPIILIERGPKNISEIKKHVRNFDTCIIFFAEKNTLYFKASEQSYSTILESNSEIERITTILESKNIPNIMDAFDMSIVIADLIDTIPNATRNFDNRGLFATNYLRSRIFDDSRMDIEKEISKIKPVIGEKPEKIFESLGWDISNNDKYDDKVSITITDQEDFSIRIQDTDVAPSYRAVATLRKSQWAILTNGRKWRLYTNKISASSTNYFEITLDPQQDSITQYFVAIFGFKSFEKIDEKTDIDIFFEEGKNYAIELEDDLSEKIMGTDGLFLDIIKGVLNHDLKTTFSPDRLEDAKKTSLKIMYRIWFLAYAESRNLLPVRDERYRPISLQSLHNKLDSYAAHPNDNTCWSDILDLFKCVRDGSVEHNLPQYDGALFAHQDAIDEIKIQNCFIVSVMRGLLERDGEAVDYASLGVRHLGNIFESLMEFGVQQVEENSMMLEGQNGAKEVPTEQESSYSYKKNDLYLAAKNGKALRKTTASYYTPSEIVEFLVWRGLKPILEEREKLIGNDLIQYEKNKTKENKQKCMDRLLDIQVLDPAMGSGHFLVEALNKITTWVTDMLKNYPRHPLIREIESNRQTILTEQRQKGITIDESMLTHDVLLKRKIMKRCIFGVDLNSMAVELTKISLWLDSFAIGVPLTYLDHHIKDGDSTIGVLLEELKNPINHTLDDWIGDPTKKSNLIEKVTNNSDITFTQVQDSKTQHIEYAKQIRPYKIMLDALTVLKIDKKIIPKLAQKNKMDYMKQLEGYVSGRIKRPDKDLKNIIKNINEKSKQYRFFHWELEMMDAFTDKRRGFDLVCGNPPWDKIRPNANEFFRNIDPKYKEKSDMEKKEIRDKHSEEYSRYKKIIDEKRAFYKNHGGMGENTDYDLYRIIIERMLQILAPNGSFSMIMPSAIVNSRAATALRQHILTKNILSLYVFENKNKLFPIDTRQRFSLLSFQNSDGGDIFPAGFYLHSLNKLENLGDSRLCLSKKKIKKLSPKMSIIYEVRNWKEFAIIQKIAKYNPKLKDVKNWSVNIGRELNFGDKKDKKLLIKHGGWPTLESKNFHQHIHNFSLPTRHVDIEKTLKRTDTIDKFYNKNKEIHENPRLVYRKVSSATNTRTMIASIMPKSMFTVVGIYMVMPQIGIFDITDDYHQLNAYLCGIYNSTTYDYILRPKIDKNVETYHVLDTPVPENFTNKIANKIARLSAILTLSETWHDDLARVFSITKDETNNNILSKRIELVAEIDALVAHHYGLNHDEYYDVLASFKSDKIPFSDEELSEVTNYHKLASKDRNTHMRKFYNHVYDRARHHHDMISKARKK